MEFKIRSSKLFHEQLKSLSIPATIIVNRKLSLLKINPFRNKRIVGHNLFLFRIRFKDSNKEKRVIYLVDKPYVEVLFILDRSNRYKDLKKNLKKLGY